MRYTRVAASDPAAILERSHPRERGLEAPKDDRGKALPGVIMAVQRQRITPGRFVRFLAPELE